MTPKPLLPSQPATADGARPSRELVEVIQRLVAQVNALQARLDAVAAVTPPAGGATVDAEARTAVGAIITAAG